MKKCPNCGRSYSDMVQVCPVCNCDVISVDLPDKAENESTLEYRFSESSVKNEEIESGNPLPNQNALTQKWLEKGMDCEKREDYQEATTLFRMAAELGDEEAAMRLGMYYNFGVGVRKDYLKAAEWYYMAANAGNTEAMVWMGTFCECGYGVAERDYKAAENWYRMAAEAGNVDGMLNMGRLMWRKERNQKLKPTSEKWYRKAAEKGNTEAMFELAHCIQEEKKRWYIEAANRGNHKAAYWLAKGARGEHNYVEALKWFYWLIPDTDQYAYEAECHLGEMYEEGTGVTQNYAEAAKHYRRAADEGGLPLAKWKLKDSSFCAKAGIPVSAPDKQE